MFRCGVANNTRRVYFSVNCGNSVAGFSITRLKIFGGSTCLAVVQLKSLYLLTMSIYTTVHVTRLVNTVIRPCNPISEGNPSMDSCKLSPFLKHGQTSSLMQGYSALYWSVSLILGKWTRLILLITLWVTLYTSRNRQSAGTPPNDAAIARSHNPFQSKILWWKCPIVLCRSRDLYRSKPEKLT